MRPTWQELGALAARTGRTREAVLCAWARYAVDPRDSEQWAAFCTFVELDALDPAWYGPPPFDRPPPRPPAEPPT